MQNYPFQKKLLYQAYLQGRWSMYNLEGYTFYLAQPSCSFKTQSDMTASAVVILGIHYKGTREYLSTQINIILTLFYTGGGGTKCPSPCGFSPVDFWRMREMGSFFMTLFLSISNRCQQINFSEFFSKCREISLRRHLVHLNFDAKIGKIEIEPFFLQ